MGLRASDFSVHGQPAVYEDRLAGDVVGGAAGDERCDTGEVLGFGGEAPARLMPL